MRRYMRELAQHESRPVDKRSTRWFFLGIVQDKPSSKRGRAVQVDPIKPTSKAPGSDRLQLKCDDLLSKFAFNFKLRRYNGFFFRVVGVQTNKVVLGRAVQVDPMKL